jgi:hypothetical protein
MRVARSMPGNRTCVNSMNIGNYFRFVGQEAKPGNHTVRPG